MATDSSASDGVILVHVRVKMMWTRHPISFSEATFIMSAGVVLPVSCVCVKFRSFASQWNHVYEHG